MTESAPILPRDFLWGASTAAHQIEGNNVASDYWTMETQGVPYVVTINEPNMLTLIVRMTEILAEADPVAAAQARRRAMAAMLESGGEHLIAGQLPPPDAAAARVLVAAHERARGRCPRTLTGWAVRPDALEIALRQAWEATGGVPLLVTENGIATGDDEQRVAYLTGAVEGLQRAVADGVDVRGYLHWSLLDNFEWNLGYRPTFGLVAVDRETFARTPKPSAHALGRIARRTA